MSTVQKPIGSGFNAASTAAEVVKEIDLSDKVAIVTGGASGIGLEITRALRSAGAHVVVPAIQPDQAIRTFGGVDRVEVEEIDLLNPVSIDAFSRRFLDSGRPLHILVNNAGMRSKLLTHDARGFESVFATNHLGHFQLFTRLRPALRRAGGARVVSVASWGHRHSPVVFDDIHFERRAYTRPSSYGQSKTAVILSMLALDVRGKKEGVRAFSLDPGGVVGTDLSKGNSTEELRASGAIDENGQPIIDPERGLKTPEQGAATAAWCATNPRLAGIGGVYCQDCDIAPLLSKEDEAQLRSGGSGIRQFNSKPAGLLPYAADPEAAEQVWTVSERLLGIKW